MPLTNAEKKRRQAEKKQSQGLKEIRGVYVPADIHDEEKQRLKVRIDRIMEARK